MEYFSIFIKSFIFFIFLFYIYKHFGVKKIKDFNAFDVIFVFLTCNIFNFNNSFLLFFIPIIFLCLFDKKFLFNKADSLDSFILIKDGIIDYSFLSIIDKDEEWVINNLDCSLNDVLFGFYIDNNIYIIKKE